jgi:hypothetical protein
MVGRFLSFEDVNWSKTVAYSMGHVGRIYINLQGASRAIVTRSVCRSPPEVIDVRNADRSGTGQPLVDRIIPREEAARPYADQARICISFSTATRRSRFHCSHRGRVLTPQIRGDSGYHRLHGIFIVGAAFAWRCRKQRPHYRSRSDDSAHSQCARTGRYGWPRVGGCAGAELRAQATQVGAAATTSTAQVDFTEEEQAEVEERALGYLG